MNRMKTGKAVGSDASRGMEVFRRAGYRLSNYKILEDERMPDQWRSVLVPIFKNKGDVQSCSNYRGISHTMKLWERVIEASLRREVTINEQQYGFMPKKKHY